MNNGEDIRILLVDDDLVDRAIVTRALRRARVRTVVTEFDAAEPAFAALLADPAAFDCGLFDLRLPDRDGLELLRDVRASGIDLPVIFLTGQGSEGVAVDLMKAGAADYLPKRQLTTERLEQSLGHALRLARTQRARVAAEQALRDSEASFRRLAENLPDAVVRFDRAGRHTYVNHAAPWSQSRSGAEVIGKTIADTDCDPEVAQRLESALARALDGDPAHETLYMPWELELDPGDEDTEAEIQVVPRWIEVRFVPERAGASGDGDRDDRAQTSVLAISRDVTAQILREQEEERRSEIERQLIGIVSHDLRNPIGAILMSTQLLERKLEGTDDVGLKRPLELLGRSGQRALRMVRDILDFTRARLGGGIPISPGDCDLEAVAEQVVAEVCSAHPNREIQLSIEGRCDGFFDADRLAQALSNLVINAITYSPPSEPVQVVLESAGPEVIVRVTNRGKGIPADVMPMLFKPFKRGASTISDRDVSRSVGLGLFIVEQIVTGHRGTIEVTSVDGVTTFAMRLSRRPTSGRLRALSASSLPAAQRRSQETN